MYDFEVITPQIEGLLHIFRVKKIKKTGGYNLPVFSSKYS
jgi:hypothetical protein